MLTRKQKMKVFHQRGRVRWRGSGVSNLRGRTLPVTTVGAALLHTWQLLRD